MLKRILRLLRWMPMIWRTRDFDYGYCMEILSYSLGELERHLREHDIHVNAERDAKRIRCVRNLIERHQNETASDMVFKQHDKRWGEIVPVTIHIPDTDFFEWRGVRLNARTPEEQEREAKEFRCAIKKAVQLEDRDWNEIWDTIKKYGRHWWC